MRKQFLLLSALIVNALFFFSNNIMATKVYAVNDDFTSAPAVNWDFNAASGHTFTYDAVNKRYKVRWGSPSSFTAKNFADVVSPGTDGKITIETILQFYSSGNSSSSGNLYFLDGAGNAIFGVWFGRTSSQWRIARSTNYPGAVTPTATATYTDILASNAPIAKVTAVLDFTTHTLDFSAQVGTFDNTTRVFTASSPSVSSTSQAFINASASNIKSLLSNYYRVSTTSGENGYDLMYMGISSEKTVSTTDVTVKFKDQDNNYFKSDEIVNEQIAGETYNATLAQKSSVTINGFTYVLNPNSPTNVVVGQSGSTLELLFRKSTYFANMLWNGTAAANGNVWSEWYQNFVNTSTATAYIENSNVLFDATASENSVVVNDPINMGTGNITISAPNYTFTGAGAFTGSGAMFVNLSGTDALSLSVLNNLTSATEVAGGNITISKLGALGSSVKVNGPSSFLPSVALPIMTVNANTLIQPSAAVSLAGVSVSPGSKLTVTSAINTANSLSAFLITPNGTINGELEFNGTATETRFGLTAASEDFLKTGKLSLTGNAFLYLDVNHTANTKVNIGSLTGDTGSKLGWGRSTALDRTVTWSVGALNENSTFAGSITNIGGYNSSGNFFAGNYTHFEKVGTATLTFAGNANTHNGNFDVLQGKLNVTGAIANSTSIVTVAADGTLAGNGTVGGATTVNGTLEGSLNFGSSLTLTGTTNLVVNGFGSAEFDVINVVGAVSVGGVLNVVVNASNPTVGQSIKLINAGSYSGAFTTMNLPAGYSFDASNGMLTYSTYTSLGAVPENNVQIYPTLSNAFVYLVGDCISNVSVFSVDGKLMKSFGRSMSSKTTIDLSDLANGSYLIQCKFDNGSMKTQHVLLQK